MSEVSSLVIVGASGAGKTTVVNGLRESDLSGALEMPKRYITRPKRLNDDLVENVPINASDFDDMVANGSIDVHWQRDLGAKSKVSYGFEPVDTRGGLPVYSANNAFTRSNNESVQKVLDSALVVVVESDTIVRANRLATRSNDLSANEVTPARRARLPR